MGLPQRKAGQGRWPGQVAPVSRFPTVVTIHPAEPPKEHELFLLRRGTVFSKLVQLLVDRLNAHVPPS